MKYKKSLGQNFLISPRIAEKMAHEANLSKKDTVIEIGPGRGVLTRYLLGSGARVVAIEKDPDLIPVLKERFSSEIKSDQLELIDGDILNNNLSLYDKLQVISYKLIANIPYYITGEILRFFLSLPNKPSTIILMVQKEVADRLIDKKESILSLSVKVYGEVSRIMKVSRGNFYPEPNVDSSVIKIDSIRNPFKNESEEKRFFEIVKCGFAHKRKKLSSNLVAISSKEKIEVAFKKLGIDTNARPEEIGLETWIKFLNLL